MCESAPSLTCFQFHRTELPLVTRTAEQPCENMSVKSVLLFPVEQLSKGCSQEFYESTSVLANMSVELPHKGTSEDRELPTSS